MGTVVDTSVLVALDRRHDGSNTDQLLATLPSDAAITGIQVAELNVGVLQADTDRRAAIRERFLSRLLERFPVLPFGEQEAYEWSRAFVHLRRAGQAVGDET